MDDTISRQQAIEMVQNRHMMLSKEKVLLINDLEKLPPAQPYTIHTDGRLWITVDDIDKVTAVVVDEHKSKFCKQFYEEYEDAQPERIKGRWEQDGHHIKCDQCGMYMCEIQQASNRRRPEKVKKINTEYGITNQTNKHSKSERVCNAVSQASWEEGWMQICHSSL